MNRTHIVRCIRIGTKNHTKPTTTTTTTKNGRKDSFPNTFVSDVFTIMSNIFQVIIPTLYKKHEFRKSNRARKDNLKLMNVCVRCSFVVYVCWFVHFFFSFMFSLSPQFFCASLLLMSLWFFYRFQPFLFSFLMIAAAVFSLSSSHTPLSIHRTCCLFALVWGSVFVCTYLFLFASFVFFSV